MYCQNCGKEHNGKFCPSCGAPADGATSAQQMGPEIEEKPQAPKVQKGYTKTWIIILFLILFFPVGLYLMWKGNWNKTVKIVVTIFFALAVIGNIVSSSGKNATSAAPDQAAASSSASQPAQEPKQEERKEVSISQAEEKKSAGMGETLEYKGLYITLDSVEYYADESEFPLDEADPGKQFVVLRFTASNESGQDDHINMFFEESYCDDVAIEPEIMMVNLEGENFWGDVANGRKRKGYVAYQLPDGWETLEFRYDHSLLGGGEMIWEVSPSDIK